MQALVFTAPSVVEVQDVPAPVPGPDEVLIDVASAGICGSELHGITQPGFRTPPLVMGHEFAGTTSDGRRVTVNPIVCCAECDLCRMGRHQICRHRGIVGVHRPGAFAEQVAVPSQLVHELPATMGWEVASMVEPLANAVHAWNLADRPVGGRIGVIGAGTIGLVTLLVARHSGAAEVVVADLSDERLAAARQLGATSTTDSLDGEFDVIFDAVGIGATHAASVDHLRPGGTAVWLGLMGTDPGFDANALIRGEKSVLGSFAYTDDEFAAAIDLAPSCDFGWVQSFPLAQGATIFTELMHGRTDVIKALLRP